MLLRNKRCPNKPWDPNLTIAEVQRSPHRALRWLYRRLTAAQRGLPQVYIAGVKKGGTTSLFAYLTAHPQVLPPFRKEVKFFLYMYDLGERWYRANFPLQRHLAGRLTVDATPNYLFDPFFAQRLMALNPQARLIVLLRDPVRRTLSHYFQNRARGLEPLPLAEALKAEPRRLAGEVERMRADVCHSPWKYHRFAYVGESLYAEQLERLWEHVPREQTLVLRSEDLFADPGATLREVERFLGLPPWEPEAYPAFKKGQYRLTAEEEAVAERLRAFFRPHNKRLYALLGREMGWDETP